MTFADWVSETTVRFREQPPQTALLVSIGDFLSGARAHLEWILARHLDPDTAIATTFGDTRARFVVDSRQEAKRAKHAIRERPVLEWFIEPIDEEWVVWDIGAYHGTYSIVCRLIGADVVAFEPNADNRARIRENAAINDVSVRTMDVALSNQSGSVSFGGDDLHPRKGIVENGEMTVTAMRGDEIDGQPDTIKIDVEGHELAVLEGMDETLATVRRALVEVHEGVDPGAVIEILERHGLTCDLAHVDRPQSYVLAHD